MQDSVMSQGVIKFKKKIKLKYLKFCCTCSILMIIVLMFILMKAIFHTYKKKMHFKGLNLILNYFKKV